MAVQIVGFVVRAQQRHTLPLPPNTKPPRVRNVSARFHIRSVAEHYASLYRTAHPEDDVWVLDIQADDRLP